MTELLVTFGLSNLCVSTALATVALVVQAKLRRPQLAHLLWLAVLLKLVTPPLVTLPFLAVPDLSGDPLAATAPFRPMLAADSLAALRPGAGDSAAPRALAPATVAMALRWLAIAWLVGSASVLVASLARIVRFHRLLASVTERAPRELTRVAEQVAHQLGLDPCPTVLTTRARLQPMVWWTGGRVRVVLPEDVARGMPAEEVRCVLAHELAHVLRRDHVVRWLEWLACVVFWWNPVAWLARRHLRANEEICCDALVLARIAPPPRAYASSLLNVVEVLASPALRPPAVASGINSGGFLERRLRMIVSNKPVAAAPRWVRAALLAAAVVVLPLGVAHADGPRQKSKSVDVKAKIEAEAAKIRAGVARGELTREQAEERLAALDEKAALVERGRAMKEDLRREHEKLRELVAAGKLSQQEMDRRTEAMRRAFVEVEAKKRAAAGEVWSERFLREERGPKEELDVLRRIRLAVASGDLTAEEGKKKAEAYRKYTQAKQKIDAAVRSGDLTKEQAAKKTAAVREAMFGKALEVPVDADIARKYTEVERLIRESVAAGKLTAEEADEKLAGLKRRLESTERRAKDREAEAKSKAKAKAKNKPKPKPKPKPETERETEKRNGR